MNSGIAKFVVNSPRIPVTLIPFSGQISSCILPTSSRMCSLATYPSPLEAERIFVDQPVCNMLVQEGVFIEAGGEEAAQLARVPAHGRGRVQGEAEDFEVHSHLFFEELPVVCRVV